MQYNDYEMDSKLRYLENQAGPNLEKLETHWGDMKMLLDPMVIHFSRSSYFQKKRLGFIAIIGVTAVLFFLLVQFPQTWKKEILPAKQPATFKSKKTDTATNKSTIKSIDTIPPTSSASKRSTKLLTKKIKRISATKVLLNSQQNNNDIKLLPQKTNSASRLKRTTKSTNALPNDSIRLVSMKKKVSTKSIAIKPVKTNIKRRVPLSKKKPTINTNKNVNVHTNTDSLKLEPGPNFKKRFFKVAEQ